MSLPDEIARVLAGYTQGARWAVVTGDCTTILPLLPEKSVAHVICDPPFEAEAHTKQRRVRSRVDSRAWRRGVRGGSEVVPVSFAAIDEATRAAVMAEFGRAVTRWVLVFCQAEAAHRWQACGEAAGLTHRRVGIWRKPDGMPQLTGDRPGVGYEMIEIMHTRGCSRWNAGGKQGVWTHATRWRPELGANAYRRGGREGQDDHETSKPVALMLDLVADFTDPGDVILDPFCGSGSTGVAALRLGRRFIGIELDPAYAELARERLRAEEAGTTLRAARAGQTSLFGGTR